MKLPFTYKIADLITRKNFEVVETLPELVAVTAVSLATPGNGNVAATTLSVKDKVPTTANCAVLSVGISGVVTSSGAFLSNKVDFRKDANSPICATVETKTANPTASAIGGAITVQVIVPLTDLKTFQYIKTDGINSSSGAQISLVGYLN